MKELLEFILQNSLPDNSKFNVKQIESEMGVTYEITVPEEYRGKVIGRGGSNIKAIRDVLNIIASKQQRRVFLKLID